MVQSDKIRLQIYLSVFIGLFTAGVAGFMFFEKIPLIDAVYFTIVTMATVGYGDIHPQSSIGKVLALVVIVGGVGTFLGVVASITDVFVNRREETQRRQKLDMITGLFFSEMGNDLLRRFARLDPESETLHGSLMISNKWENKDFDRARDMLKHRRPGIDLRRGDPVELRDYLQRKVDLLLRLIENPIIQEHVDFTELLRAVYHLRDELLHRSDFSDIPNSDRKHLEGDIARIYNLLISEWLRYMEYLKVNYGYLFSLAMRTNPFDPAANAVVLD